MISLCLLAMPGCSQGVVDADPIGTALGQIDMVAQLRCPEPAPADVARIRAPAPPRPWTAETGATRGQLQAHIDRQDVALAEKTAAGRRVLDELARCRGAAPPGPARKPATS